MLSKLKFSLANVNRLSKDEQEELLSGLKASFGGELAELRHAQSGVLSMCMYATLNGEPRFFKTHIIPSGRSALEREAYFLKAVAADHVDPRLSYVIEGRSDRVWLHTRLLAPSGMLNPLQVLNLIDDCDQGLMRCPALKEMVPSNHSVFQLFCEAESAINDLNRKNLLSSFVTDRASSGLYNLKIAFADLPLKLCHGDLGPANIMSKGETTIAIDWEDAFWGVDGYDYLYWLTFFENRKWLSTKVLGHTTLARSTEVALMTVILLLKSWISVRDGSYFRNTISIDERLREVINLE